MQRVRALLRLRRGWMMLLLACALAARLLVPVGFMPVTGGGVVTLQLCSGMADPSAAAMAMPGMDHRDAGHDGHGRIEAPCAFAGLGMSVLGPVDPVILLAAILFAFVLATRARAEPPPRPMNHLRPPLRGPPLTA